MKIIRFVLMMCSFGFALSLQAQDTIYVKNGKWVKKEKKANSYLVVSHEHDVIKVDAYTLEGTIKSTVTYSTFSEKHNDCKREGQSVWFFPNGKIKTVCDYRNNKRNGTHRKFHENGKEKFVAEYANGKKDGKLMMYYPDGTIWRKESYKKGELQEGHLYNEKGEEVIYEPIESMPQYPGGEDAMKKYITRNLVYPPKAAKQKQEGRVILQFVIDQKGRIINPEIFKGVNDDLNSSAMAVINKMAHEICWKPGIQDGEPVKVKYTMPVTFKIP